MAQAVIQMLKCALRSHAAPIVANTPTASAAASSAVGMGKFAASQTPAATDSAIRTNGLLRVTL